MDKPHFIGIDHKKVPAGFDDSFWKISDTLRHSGVMATATASPSGPSGLPIETTQINTPLITSISDSCWSTVNLEIRIYVTCMSVGRDVKIFRICPAEDITKLITRPWEP